MTHTERPSNTRLSFDLWVAVGFLLQVVLFGCASVDARQDGRASSKRVLSEKYRKSVRAKTAHWVSPLKNVSVSSHFGTRNGDSHDGVDLRAGEGVSIRAVDQGRVIFASSRISGYGLMTILKHPSGLASVYAHQSRVFVKKGQYVKKGTLIGKVGQTGRASGPHLHFEIRDGVRALNPVLFMAALKAPSRGRLASRSSRGWNAKKSSAPPRIKRSRGLASARDSSINVNQNRL